jgi:hypothetical protein
LLLAPLLLLELLELLLLLLLLLLRLVFPAGLLIVAKHLALSLSVPDVIALPVGRVQ